jgi:hypothetical protein
MPRASLVGRRSGVLNPFAPHGVRLEELRDLEASERALGLLYLRYSTRATRRRQWLQRMARQQLIHAQLLRARRTDLGAPPDEDPLLVSFDDPWIRGTPDDPETLLRSLYAAVASYHDHLIDHDPETATLMRERILLDHEQALAELEQDGSAPRLLGV